MDSDSGTSDGELVHRGPCQFKIGKREVVHVADNVDVTAFARLSEKDAETPMS